MRKIVAFFVLITVIGLLFIGCDNNQGGKKVYEIKLTSNDSTTTIWMEQMKKASDSIRERTDGAVNIAIHGNGEMLVGDAGLEAVMSDAAVFYFADPNNYGDYIPEFNTISAPYLWQNYEEVEAFMLTKLMKDIFNKAKDANVHIVGDTFFLTGPRSVMANAPIKNLDDLEKLTIRVPSSSIYIDTFDALGCNYQAMDMSQTYNALETGMIDGCENIVENFVNNGIAQSISTPYYSLTEHMLCIVTLATGQGYWETLPEEYQKIITEEFAKIISISNKEVADSEDEGFENLKEQGVTIIEIEDLEPFKQKVKAYSESLPRYNEISQAILDLRNGL